MSLDQRRKEGGSESKSGGHGASASSAQGNPRAPPAHKGGKDKDDKPKEEVKVHIDVSQHCLKAQETRKLSDIP